MFHYLDNDSFTYFLSTINVVLFISFFLQEDVAYIKSGSLFKLVGFVNLGRSYENINVLTTGNILSFLYAIWTDKFSQI